MAGRASITKVQRNAGRAWVSLGAGVAACYVTWRIMYHCIEHHPSNTSWHHAHKLVASFCVTGKDYCVCEDVWQSCGVVTEVWLTSTTLQGEGKMCPLSGVVRQRAACTSYPSSWPPPQIQWSVSRESSEASSKSREQGDSYMPLNTTDSKGRGAVSHAGLCASGGMSCNLSTEMDVRGIIIFAHTTNNPTFPPKQWLPFPPPPQGPPRCLLPCYTWQSTETATQGKQVH